MSKIPRARTLWWQKLQWHDHQKNCNAQMQHNIQKARGKIFSKLQDFFFFKSDSGQRKWTNIYPSWCSARPGFQFDPSKQTHLPSTPFTEPSSLFSTMPILSFLIPVESSTFSPSSSLIKKYFSLTPSLKEVDLLGILPPLLVPSIYPILTLHYYCHHHHFLTEKKNHW